MALLPERQSALAAVLFDLDGTLLNTEQPWLDAVRSLLASLGVNLTDAEVLEFEGVTVDQAADLALQYLGDVLPSQFVTVEDLGAALEAQTLTHHLGAIRWCAGAADLLAGLRSAGVPIAIVTSSSRAWFDTVARQAELGPFAHVITADDVSATKPHPEPYLVAAERLGVDPSRCVVFEDSEVGMRAGLAAGCTTVLVRSERAPWAAAAHHTRESLAGIDAAWVSKLLAAPSDALAH